MDVITAYYGINKHYYTVHADFKKTGQTELIINTPDGATKRYDLNIELFSYEIKEK